MGWSVPWSLAILSGSSTGTAAETNESETAESKPRLQPLVKTRPTFSRPELHQLRQRSHSFGVFGLNPEVVNGVEVQIHDLVGQPVAADGLHHPVVDGDVLIQGVVQDVACDTLADLISCLDTDVEKV